MKRFLSLLLCLVMVMSLFTGMVVVNADPAPTNYKVTYDANGGSGNVADEQKQVGTFTPADGTGLTNEGYTFKGWSTSENASAPDSKFEIVDQDITLYAVWEKNPTSYTVTLPTGNGYTAAFADGSNGTVTPGGTCTFTITVLSGYVGTPTVWANGKRLTTTDTSSPYSYTITNINENQTVTVSDVSVANVGYTTSFSYGNVRNSSTAVSVVAKGVYNTNNLLGTVYYYFTLSLDNSLRGTYALPQTVDVSVGTRLGETDYGWIRSDNGYEATLIVYQKEADLTGRTVNIAGNLVSANNGVVLVGDITRLTLSSTNSPNRYTIQLTDAAKKSGYKLPAYVILSYDVNGYQAVDYGAYYYSVGAEYATLTITDTTLLQSGVYVWAYCDTESDIQVQFELEGVNLTSGSAYASSSGSSSYTATFEAWTSSTLPSSVTVEWVRYKNASTSVVYTLGSSSDYTYSVYNGRGTLTIKGATLKYLYDTYVSIAGKEYISGYNYYLRITVNGSTEGLVELSGYNSRSSTAIVNESNLTLDKAMELVASYASRTGTNKLVSATITLQGNCSTKAQIVVPAGVDLTITQPRNKDYILSSTYAGTNSKPGAIALGDSASISLDVSTFYYEAGAAVYDSYAKKEVELSDLTKRAVVKGYKSGTTAVTGVYLCSDMNDALDLAADWVKQSGVSTATVALAANMSAAKPTISKSVTLAVPSGVTATLTGSTTLNGSIDVSGTLSIASYTGSGAITLTATGAKVTASSDLSKVIASGVSGYSVKTEQSGSSYTYTLSNGTEETPAASTTPAAPATGTYTVTATASVGGTVTPATTTANGGGTVTLTITPQDGYEINTIFVNGTSFTASQAPLTASGSGYTMTLTISKDTTVMVAFVASAAVPVQTVSYPDVAESSWYGTPVAYVSRQGLMTGYPNGEFLPNGNMTIAEYLTIMYRYAYDKIPSAMGAQVSTTGDNWMEGANWMNTYLLSGTYTDLTAPMTRYNMADINYVVLQVIAT